MDACIFCQIVSGDAPASIVYADDEVMALLALHPANPGHLLVIPTAHTVGICDLPEVVATHFFTISMRLERTLRATVPNDGCTLLMHEGAVSHPANLHVRLHIIPRQDDDRVQLDRRAP